jgi:hypothetical protein
MDKLINAAAGMKNQFLVFCFFSATLLILTSPSEPAIFKICIHLAGLIFLFLGAAFWLYAWKNLPSSKQEELFADMAIQVTQTHNDKMATSKETA